MKKKSFILLAGIISAFFVGMSFSGVDQYPVEVNATNEISENSTLPNTANTANSGTKEPSQWATDFKAIIDTPVGWGTLTVGGVIVLVITIFSRTSLGKKTYKKYEKTSNDLHIKVEEYKNKAESSLKEIQKLNEAIDVLNNELKNVYNTMKSQTRNNKIKQAISEKETNLEISISKIKGGSDYGEQK